MVQLGHVLPLDLLLFVFDEFSAKVGVSFDLVTIVDDVFGVLVGQDEELVEDGELCVLGRVQPDVAFLLGEVPLLLIGVRVLPLVLRPILVPLVHRNWNHIVVLDAVLVDGGEDQ